MDYIAKAREVSRRWREAHGLPPRVSALQSLTSPLSNTDGLPAEEQRLSRECGAIKAIEETEAWLPSYAYPWPDRLPHLGPRRIGPFTPCVDCGRGSWASYGDSVLCCPCAITRLLGLPFCSSGPARA